MLSDGNDVRLQTKGRVKYDWRKYSFTNSTVGIWNSLSINVVLCGTINTFKA